MKAPLEGSEPKDFFTSKSVPFFRNIRLLWTDLLALIMGLFYPRDLVYCINNENTF